MSRLLVLCLAVVLVTACKKNDAEPAAAAPAAKAAAEPSNDTAGTPEGEMGDAPAADGEQARNDQNGTDEPEQKVELKAAMVAPYLEYREAAVDSAMSAHKKLQEAERKKEEGKLDAMQFVNEATKIREAHEAETAAALKKSGLTEAQLDALNDVSSAVLIAVMGRKNDPSKELEKQLAAGAANATPEQLAEAKAAMAEMKKGFEELTNAAEARKEHGDEVVDAMLARGEELEKLLSAATDGLGGN